VFFGNRATLRETPLLPKQVKEFLLEWEVQNPEILENLCEEYHFLKKYRAKFKELEFPPIFVTVDAVVINNGHILLVKRRSAPGKGLWALPGGFLNQSEKIRHAIIRELIEETRIDVHPNLLKSALKGIEPFDAPNRSLRGRTITHAGLIVLNYKDNPRVKGSDDAEKAKWFTINEFYQMTEQMFEDHHSIGQFMINRA
jgi:bifunctional NMN adenylyltransferase/nudix hydrolase